MLTVIDKVPLLVNLSLYGRMQYISVLQIFDNWHMYLGTVYIYMYSQENKANCICIIKYTVLHAAIPSE